MMSGILFVLLGVTVASAGTLRLTLDGRPAFVDWDPDNHEIRLDATAVKQGRHVLKGTLSDFLGNSATLPPRTFVLSR